MEKFNVDFFHYCRKNYQEIPQATWNDVENLLLRLKDKDGCVRLSLFPEPDIGPVQLSVSSSYNYYFLTLLEYLINDSTVRTYYDSSKPTTKILFYADYWPECQLIQDLDFVIRIFKEFYTTGNVSQDILN